MTPELLFPPRIARRIVILPSGCWQFNGRASNKEGHRQVRWKGKLVYIHRLAYALAHGRVPYSKYVCHLCDFPPCCNPDDLIAGTARTNLKHQYRRFRRKRKPQELAA